MKKAIRIPLAFVAVCVFIVTIAAAHGGAVDPRTTPLPGLVTMALPWLISATVIITVASIFFFRRLAIAGAIATLICLPEALTICPLNIGDNDSSMSGHDSDSTFSVMTFNTYYFLDYKSDTLPAPDTNSTVKAILAADPDIALLQECAQVTFPDRTPYIGTTDSDSLTSRYPYRLSNGRSSCILSKFPVTEIQVDINTDASPSFSVTRYAVDIRGRKLNILSLHLQSLMLSDEAKLSVHDVSYMRTQRKDISIIRHELLPKIANAMRIRAGQAHEVRQLIDSISGPLIVCGDFNDVPLCYAIRTISGTDLKNAYTESAFGFAATYRKRGMSLRIDHMLFRAPLSAVSSRRIADGCSDHFPIMTTFNFDNTNNITH